MQNVSFSFSPSLNLGTQIRCLQNCYANLKSALDQPDIWYIMTYTREQPEDLLWFKWK